MTGPFAIVCRAHSGGRVLSEAFVINGIQMGALTETTKDTVHFALEINANVKEIINAAFDYESLALQDQRYYQDLMSSVVQQFVKNHVGDQSLPFGWKFAETIFTLPPLFDALPNSKAIHLIRDGRDVMLSRIESRFEPGVFRKKFNKVLIFGDRSVTHYKQELLDAETVEKYRTELELIHWQTVVEYGKKLRRYKEQYMEVRYEDLCENPVDVLQQIFDFINIPLKEVTKNWISSNISTNRIGKWKSKPLENQKIAEIASQTLQSFGYI